ncbi:GIY-YIG nuclease family protein [Paenibacillus hunanensis]|uniref:GIY-YIG nuclease family protein n=1 Tax=Paenibacillus hunanensis TaxID=539262 RepID=UPI002026C9E2|nr:GIY-YIG nuclease family protein [Paenibacillus hunanensis]MCL9662130.1 GIY-YIG nuclease family protein [Paenibacillus hunanensis]
MNNRAELLESNVSKEAPEEYLQRCIDLQNVVKNIWAQTPLLFQHLVPSNLAEVDGKGGIYIIGLLDSNEILYVGRTVNLKQRLYTNHLMGNQSNARLKKYLVADKILHEFALQNGKELFLPNDADHNHKMSFEEAKNFLRNRCYVKFILIDESRIRGLQECGLAYALNVKYIEEEH